MPVKIAALVLAAGRASRFGGPQTKVLAPVDHEPMVRRSVMAAIGAGLPVTVVVGYQSAEVRAALEDLPVKFVENPDFAAGMSTSLQAGLAALPDAFDGVLVLLADMPRVSKALCRQLIEAFDENRAASAIAPVFNGERGNPVLISRRIFGAIAQLSGDQGARKILDRAAGVIELPVEDAGVRLDIDTPDALKKFSSDLPD